MLQQQIADTAGAVAVIAEEAMRPEAVSTVTELSVWDLTMRGGLIMIPLAILSIISIYIFVERYIVIFKAGREDTSFMKRIKEYIHDGEVESARNLCARTDTPYARLISKGISRIGRPMQDVLVTIENTGNMEIARLEKGLPWLATTAAGGPMIGFLGTVIGMVNAFYNLASAGTSANIAVLADGIYAALVTTVAGLIVGIIALFAYNFLVARINKVMNSLEAKTMEFMDLLNEPA
ncbi:MAG: MotA/TolQ/ExbB proton channel family protein [Duncaniella sp.]|nr:MotA/TolQ/ExbB proton channel family protein [Duncaniella sp.]MDE5751012.1 MotA/TolQ/ExbB proton channel family protein [Duncaniella sp.]MDE5917903.1 MotA/TolQ/ExbB proton channel family protein [Duncaniella sp.]MDE6169843.1 MotA/TolQ/ExbB proton channel family protein [Duncaniella sp.]MDE6327467.1 MotA/TolQ/ExbB proton channel family protein [Duncaniella sp.]